MKPYLWAVLALTTALPAAAQVPSVDIYLLEIERGGDQLTFSAPTNATARPGYDNQPAFLPDRPSFYFTSMREDEQADIYRFDLDDRSTHRVTATAESEYSPTPRPDGRFTTVRVEADSTQRLWSFAADGTDPRVVLEKVTGIGYHAWGNEHELVLFVLGDPHELHRADVGTGLSQRVAMDIGRSLHRIPGRDAWSFTQRVGEDAWRVRLLDIATSELVDLVDAPGPGSEDCAWTPWSTLWMVHEGILQEWDPRAGESWAPLHDLGRDGLNGITRLALSPDGRWLAVVAAEPPPPSDESSAP